MSKTVHQPGLTEHWQHNVRRLEEVTCCGNDASLLGGGHTVGAGAVVSAFQELIQIEGYVFFVGCT